MLFIAGSFCVPFVSALRLSQSLNPINYDEYEKAPPSSLEDEVQIIARRILKAESEANGPYAERIQEMLNDLPSHILSRDVDSLAETRLKVVTHNNPNQAPHITGTDMDNADRIGKYYLSVSSKETPEHQVLFEKALPWIVAHEMKHLLNQDGFKLCFYKTIASSTTCIIGSLIMGCSFPAALVTSIAAVGTNAITHSLLSKHFEHDADLFANKHSTHEERQNAINWLELEQRKRANGGFKAKLIETLLYPWARIDNAKKTLAADKKKIA